MAKNPPLTPDNTRIELLVDSVPVGIITNVLSFSADEINDPIRNVYVGRRGARVSRIRRGFRGTLTVSPEDPSVDEMRAQIAELEARRIPYEISIPVQTTYPDGRQALEIYPDVTIDFGTRIEGSTPQTRTLNWQNGDESIRVST